MINLLIDTCTWIDLLNVDEKNEYLAHLEFWINNNYLKLITHEIIIKEWNDHKLDEKNKFEQSLNTKYKHAKEVIIRERLPMPYDLEPNTLNIEKQIAKIDELLQHAEVLKTTKDVKEICSDRTIKPRKAPFHNKLDSTKDAYIIFTALKFFSKLKEDFVFISSNKSDFGSPDNLEREIHPEIIENYAKIKIQYYSEIARAIVDFKNILPASIVFPEESQPIENETNNEFQIDTSKSILDQLYDYLALRFKEINFVPTHLLVRHYPFVKNSTSFANYSLFSISIDNDQLFQFFNSFEVLDEFKIIYKNTFSTEGTLNYDEKIKTILTRLTGNLVFEINDKNSSKKVNIRYLLEEDCDCVKCNLNKFKFVRTFNQLHIRSNNLKELMKISYTHYRIGNYVKAAKSYKKSLVVALKSKQNINAFIIQYNLSKLSIFLRNYYWGEHSQEVLSKELKTIDLNNEFSRFRSEDNIKLLEWIKDDSYYSNCRDNIQNTVSKIIDQYYDQLKGGWSLNSHVWKLINDYAEIDNFINDNYIIYDKYSEFKELTTLLIEGLMASHAIHESHTSRFEYFDDWIISKLLIYGSSEEINKFFLRYKLKKIKYIKSSNRGDSFMELIDNFFNNYRLKETFYAHCEKGNRTFWDFYNTLFCNLLTIISICDFDDDVINDVSNKLLIYLEQETYISIYNIKYIRYYLYRLGAKIYPTTIEKFFHLAINNSKYHDERIFETIVDVIQPKKISFDISEDTFKSIKTLAFGKCESCKKNHESTIIIPLFQSIYNLKFKIELVDQIKLNLQEKFDFYLFYNASLFEILSLDEVLFSKFIEEASAVRVTSSFKSAFTNDKIKRFDKVNELLNLCFKLEIKTEEERFNRFKDLDDYYNWLFDMTNFDYQKFQPKWVIEYPTKYYYQRIAKSKKVENALKKYLRKNHDSEVQNIYFNIYLREH